MSKTAEDEDTPSLTHKIGNSDRLWIGILAGIIVWIAASYVIFTWGPETSMMKGVIGLLALLFLAGLPILMWADIDNIRRRHEWQPKKSFWIPLAFIPMINVISGFLYLMRRREHVGLDF